MTNTLSVCMIIKDEKKNIQRCIESFTSIADEIIVVDTGSTDGTLTILKEMGIEYYQAEWNDNFSDIRNIAINYASKDFILSIDADEVLVNPSTVREVLAKADEKVGGFLVEIASPASPSDSQHIYFGKNVRLFRNHPEIRFEGIIHEQIAKSIVNTGFTIEDSKIMLNHRGYLNRIDMLKKHKRNLSMLLQAHEIDKENPNYYYYAGKSLMILQEFETASSMFEKAITHLEENNPMLQMVYNAYAHNLLSSGHIDKSIEYAKKSLEIQEHQVHAYIIIAECEFLRKNYSDSRTYYKKIIVYNSQIRTTKHPTGDYYIPPEEIFFRSGRAALAMKDYESASTDFKNALKINPGDCNSITGLANVQFKLGNYLESRELLAKALKLSPEDEHIKNFYDKVSLKIAPASLTPAEKKATLSVCMIVKNEENNLPKCLNSIKDLADEIIIVDTGSQDNTKKIAEQFGAKIFDFEWIDDFAAARNVSIMHATMDWILYIDADETLEENSKSDFKQMLSLIKEPVGAINCVIEGEQTNPDGTSDIHRGAYPRIFRNYGYPTIKFSGAVHEQITPSLRELKKETIMSDITIQHSGYAIEPDALLEKVKRNYQLLIKQLQKEPKNAYIWHQLGQTLGQMKLLKEAEEALLFAESLGTLSDSISATNSALLSHYSGKRGDYQKALYHAEKSVSLVNDFLYARYLKAFALLYLEQFDLAENEFIEALKISDKKQKISGSGFEIIISKENILMGYEMAKNKRIAIN